MASLAEILNEGEENQENQQSLEVIAPEEIVSFWDISAEVPRPPTVSNGGRILRPEEFIVFLEPTRYAKSDALTSFNELARISMHIQAILNKIKLRRNICIHSSSIREKYHLVGKTVFDTSRTVFPIKWYFSRMFDEWMHMFLRSLILFKIAWICMEILANSLNDVRASLFA